MTSAKSKKLAVALARLLLALSASTSARAAFTTPIANGAAVKAVTGPNVMTLTVDGATCGTGPYQNMPCVAVTLCSPGTKGAKNCEKISNLLLDTGSFGLRLFKQAVTSSALLSSLAPIKADDGNTLATCAQFGDGSALWGPVVKGDLVLGGESAVTVPIQLIDSTFGAVPDGCPSPSTGADESGFNGILGVGLQAQDCGDGCAGDPTSGIYFSCTGSDCEGATASLAQQVVNPITQLPLDNNGLILELPAVAAGGAASATGYLVLGIGTRTNNKPPASVHAYTADPVTGNFSTDYGGTTFDAFLDSGSNALYFSTQDTNLGDCGDQDPNAQGWFCPSANQTVTATTVGASGAQGTVSFAIGNFEDLVKSGNHVFSDIGANMAVGGATPFDWGLPFFLGRNVYVGFDSKTSSLGSGPYWAY
jgi:hypothetical protein